MKDKHSEMPSKSHLPATLLVEIGIGLLVLAFMVYALTTDLKRLKPFAPDEPVKPDCGALFQTIRAGNVAADVTGCDAEFARHVAALTTPYTLTGTALRAGTKTISLYGATVERVNRNPGGQLGANAIAVVRIGHGQPAITIDLEFGDRKAADEAFVLISNTLSKLR